jgi:hypothetical protein
MFLKRVTAMMNSAFSKFIGALVWLGLAWLALVPLLWLGHGKNNM